jgi:hypothetical protein
MNSGLLLDQIDSSRQVERSVGLRHCQQLLIDRSPFRSALYPSFPSLSILRHSLIISFLLHVCKLGYRAVLRVSRRGIVPGLSTDRGPAVRVVCCCPQYRPKNIDTVTSEGAWFVSTHILLCPLMTLMLPYFIARYMSSIQYTVAVR